MFPFTTNHNHMQGVWIMLVYIYYMLGGVVGDLHDDESLAAPTCLRCCPWWEWPCLTRHSNHLRHGSLQHWSSSRPCPQGPFDYRPNRPNEACIDRLALQHIMKQRAGKPASFPRPVVPSTATWYNMCLIRSGSPVDNEMKTLHYINMRNRS